MAVIAVLAYFDALVSSLFCASMAGLRLRVANDKHKAMIGKVATTTRVTFHEKYNAIPSAIQDPTSSMQRNLRGCDMANCNPRVCLERI
jgi:hypothetical protein